MLIRSKVGEGVRGSVKVVAVCHGIFGIEMSRGAMLTQPGLKDAEEAQEG